MREQPKPNQKCKTKVQKYRIRHYVTTQKTSCWEICYLLTAVKKKKKKSLTNSHGSNRRSNYYCSLVFLRSGSAEVFCSSRHPGRVTFDSRRPSGVRNSAPERATPARACACLPFVPYHTAPPPSACACGHVHGIAGLCYQRRIVFPK